MQRIRLKAFTLLELTIALLLVAVLSGFAYYIFNTFNRHSLLKQQQKQEQYSLDLLIHRLKIDCAQADSIGYRDQHLYFSDSLGQIDYHFSDELVLRQQYQLRTDSFHIATAHPVVQYVQKKKVTTGLVQQADITLYFKGESLPLQLQKTYSAQQIIQALTQP